MRLRRPFAFFKKLGPGIITGAADDDPSGITTFTQAGAQFGTGMLWVNLYILPLVFAVQEVAARLALVTGKGIAKNLKEHYPPVFVNVAVLLLVIANTINLGADLGAIATAIQLLLPINFSFILIAATAGILVLELFTSYKQYAKVLKWLSLSLLAYIITGFFLQTNIIEALKLSLIPVFSTDSGFLLTLVGIMGTTISPYVIFWQANEEVEEEMDKHLLHRGGGLPIVSRGLIRKMRLDTLAGMAFSGITAWFIVLTAAKTLFPNGITTIESAAQAALALEPLVQSFPHAGFLARLLFTLGIVGTGLLAVPIFSASSSYAISELLGWKEGLNNKPQRAKAFYATMVVSTLVGLLINYLGINPIRALVYAAVLNGIVAAPLIAALLPLASNKTIMGEHVSPLWSKLLGWLTFVLMATGSILLLVSFLF
jgi:Mn2+/Fe2+ NRAMP family transporter